MVVQWLAVADVWLCLGWTMLHFMWVGALVVVLALASKYALRRKSADLRHGAALGWLTVLVIAPVGIAVWVGTGQRQLSPIAASGSPGEDGASFPPANAERGLRGGPESARGDDSSLHLLAPSSGTLPPEHASAAGAESVWVATVGFLPWIWLIGAPVTFAWSVLGLAGAERLRRLARPVTGQDLNVLCRRFSDSLRISRTVAILICQRVSSPILVGILQPAILLPPALVTGLSPQQLEMILLHELAHVRRWDNLLNFLQRVVESLLFFHPAVWIVSRWVRQERELCCDDMVMSHLGQRESYAETLLAIAHTVSVRGKARPPVVALPAGAVSAAAQNHLRLRIRRILTREEETMQVSRSLVAATAVALLTGLALRASFELPGTLAQEPDPRGTRALGAAPKVSDNQTRRANATRKGEPPTIIDDIARAWREREQRFRSGKIVIEEARFVPRGGLDEIRVIRPEVASQGPIPPKDTLQKYRRTLMFEREKLRYSEDEPVWSLPDARFETRHQDHVWDGKVGKSLRKETPQDTFDYVGHLWPNARMIASMARLRPVMAHYRPSHGDLSQIRRYSFTGRRGQIDMSSCIVLEASVGADAISGVKRSIWVDPERDFIVRRWMSELDGRTLGKTDLFYSEDRAHGWLPSRWEYLEHGKDGVLRDSVKATVVEQALNVAMEPEDFRLEFPPGTHLTDHAVTTAKDEDFLVGPDGTRKPLVPGQSIRKPTPKRTPQH